MAQLTIYFGDNLPILRNLPSAAVDLIYIDPPFNTGKVQSRTQIATTQDADGDRTGFQGKRYRTEKIGTKGYGDTFDDYLGFLQPRLVEAYRLLKADGSLFFHIDYREVHYCKVLLDSIFGRDSFLNEIIWAYDYGARSKTKWPAKHDNILWYAKDPANYQFHLDEVDRIPYMAPGLVGPEKAALGKTPTDCYSEDTDILTSDGWIPFAKLTLSHRVASVSPEGKIEYSLPSKIHAFPYTGEMLNLETRTINLLVTPNHNLYLRPKHSDHYQLIPAQEANRAQFYALRNQMAWSGIRQDRFSVPSVAYQRIHSARPLPDFEMGDWCEFMGWYLSEGSTTFYRDRAEVLISQRRVENLSAIADLLERMGLRYHQTKQGFMICNKQLATYLAQFGHAHEKYIPRGLLSLPPDHLTRLYDGLMRGDGNKKGNCWTYFTTSTQLASDVQELIIKLGFNSNITKSRVENPNWRTKYCVSRRISRESTVFPARHIKTVAYEGMVYCCTVEPYHTLVVRRDGKAAVCGNCWWHTIVSPNGKEKTGYPTQKPRGVLDRIVKVHSRPGDLLLDFFAGSGTFGESAIDLKRDCILIDCNREALQVMEKRFVGADVQWIG